MDRNLGETWLRFVRLLEVVQDRLHVRDKVRRLQELAATHPMQAFVLAMVISLCSIPVGVFIIFACTSVLVTFFSFIFFEGFLLVFGAVALSGSLIVFAILALVLSAILIGLAGTFIGGRHVLRYVQVNHDAWSVRAEQVYLHCLRQAETWGATHQDATGENQENQHRENARSHED